LAFTVLEPSGNPGTLLQILRVLTPPVGCHLTLLYFGNLRTRLRKWCARAAQLESTKDELTVPRRNDIKKILIIGSGPIVIGQACEFDYSGTQACKALREEGYEVVLVNSNPATIMTDPGTADRTYIEPITWQYVEEIIKVERPCALLPTLGGQTGLNTAMALVKHGVLEKYGVEMIGAKEEVIKRAEERDTFKQIMLQIGLDVPRSFTVHNLDEAREAVKDIGLPIIIRASFTLGGTGGGIAYNIEEFDDMIRRGLALSPINEILLEESILGWKEYEMEVMRDNADNVVIICAIENFDPMGVHTGDSITVAPAQTLTDKEYQRMRDATIKIMRAIGVETGGSNVQFAIHPDTGRMTDRNESARQPIIRAGVEGDGFSDREDRRQAGRGLST
jgi:carbamoyl-phosphate synthase large subunit